MPHGSGVVHCLRRRVDRLSQACGSDTASPGPACNTLVNDGPTVSLMLSTATAPPATGGTVVDGTYVLSGATAYTNGGVTAPPTSFRAVMQIAGNIMQQVGTFNGAEQRYTSTFSTSGSNVTTMDTCPAPKTATHQFIATATNIHIIDSSAVGTVEQTYTKR